ncbi:5-dehydro-4-deoxyglucarate dehydratase [Elioraea sp.]|uniref:5-dehydro-4-deoxyglucarate dehydratase n=1 Tax=Elioraea sp. TaxID=2185103 RepID=UPI0025C02941|nr:5-dehydro-4-deoxyglucarate dehydratase [Elioraea sp.]
MMSPLSPDGLRALLRAPALLSFPLTDFDADGAFHRGRFEERVVWQQSFAPQALFIAGVAGEYFSLDEAEEKAVLEAALAVRRPGVPMIAAAGKGTREAIAAARMAERAGADGILLLPPYLIETSQRGITAHIRAVCAATGLGVIVYSRGNARLTADTLAHLCDACPNLVAFKDGTMDIEQLWAIRTRLGDRVAIVNGMPTAEIYAPAYRGLGVEAYSSAVFNFLPAYALDYFHAVRAGDLAALERMMAEFYEPYGRLRGRQAGYAVSIVKAGATVIGRSAGPVRPPLSELTEEEQRELAALIGRVVQPTALARPLHGQVA